MLLSAVIALFAILLFYIVNYKNKKTSVMCLWCTSLVVLIIVAVLYIIKIGNYTFSSDFERNIYNFFFKFSLHIRHISRIYNITVMLFMICGVFYISQYVKLNKIIKFTFVIPAIIFVVINDYYVSNSLYISIHSAQNGAVRYNEVMQMIGLINRGIIYIYTAVIPLLLFIMSVFTQIFVKRRQCICALVNSLIINTYFNFVFVTNAFKQIFVTNVDFARLPVKYAFDIVDFTSPAVMLPIILIVALLVVLWEGYGRDNIKALSQSESENSDVSMMLHVQKNAFLAIQRYLKLVTVAVKKENFDNVENYTETCETLIKEQLQSIADMLEKLKDDKSAYVPVDIISCINEAVKKSIINDDVELEYNFSVERLFMLARRGDIVEMFVNLINNSVEAKDTNKNEELYIKISVISEKDYCQIEVEDNGCGILKSDLNKIFKPFYSTKARLKYGGLGLCCVDRVVRLHNGAIKIDSQPGRGTKIKIALPV